MNSYKSLNIFLILCCVIMILTGDNPPALGMPQMDFTLYGKAIAADKMLTQNDTDYVLTLEINGIELARYVMGSLPSFQDNYVLKVPMDSDPGIPEKGYTGDMAHIFINGIPISENPITVGSPGETISLDISVP